MLFQVPAGQIQLLAEVDCFKHFGARLSPFALLSRYERRGKGLSRDGGEKGFTLIVGASWMFNDGGSCFVEASGFIVLN